MKDESSGAYIKHCCSLMQCNWNVGRLEECGFIIHHNRFSPIVQQALEGTVFVEDEFAELYGQLSTSLSVQRFFRGLWLTIGYPWSLQRLRSWSSVIWDQFLKDIAIFKKLEAMVDRCPKLEAIYKRHVFQKPSCRQFMMAAEDPTMGSPEWKRAMIQKLEDHAAVCCPTQVIEDMFSIQKGHKVMKGCNKIRRPEKSYSLVLSQKVIDRTHRYQTPSTDKPVGGKCDKMVDDCWKLPKQLHSMNWSSIVSTSAVSPYYSPKAENFCQNCSDLPLLRQLDATDDLNAVKDAWLGGLTTFEHQLLLRVRIGEKLVWHHALFHLPSSAVALWPGQLCEAKTRAGIERYFLHQPHLEDTYFCNSLYALIVW